MKHEHIIAELEQLAAQFGLTLRYEKGDFEGGYCVLKEEKILVMNKKLPEARKASVLAQALSEIGLDNVFIKPALRQYIEDETAKASKAR
jgi:hypothetical protein